jgi:hypothetical protein
MSGSQQMTAAQSNALAEQLIKAQGLEMTQQIFTTTVTPSSNSVLNIQPRNVGLLRGFWIEVNATMYVASGTANLTAFGPANLLSQIAFYDLNNNLRHNTAGWHVAFLDAIRKGYPFPYGLTTGNPITYGPNFAPYVVAAPATLPTTAPTSANVKMLYYLPISYSKDDLRGAVYMGVTNATANLQLTLNYANFCPASGDATLAVYSGGTTPTWSSAMVTVYQDYIDQLPISNGAPVLPLLDLSTVYELKNTSLTGITVGQDFPIPYSNFRSFLSTFLIYDNAGVLNAGTDINYLALQSANFTNIIKTDPYLWSTWTRDMLLTDLPKGVYYLDTRRKPLSTNQFGNLQLLLNASASTAGANVLMGYEDFALINNISLAGSLPGS